MVVGALKEHFTVPYGVEAIYDGDATMEICAATGAAFTRCLFTGAWAGDLGLVDRDVAKTLRLKAALRLDELKLFYFCLLSTSALTILSSPPSPHPVSPP